MDIINELEIPTEVLLGIFIATAVIAAVIIILITIAEWKILTKAGEKGWKSLIPFYSIFVSHHIVGMAHIWFILEMIIWFIETVIAAFVEFPEWFELSFMVLTLVFTLVSEIIHINKMCKCFGKDTGFKIGMIFLPYIFSMIIAFGSAKYTHPAHE